MRVAVVLQSLALVNVFVNVIRVDGRTASR